jgi:hypothetical protein
VLPLAFAITLNLLRQPALRMLHRLHVPKALGAPLLILVVFATIVGWTRRFPLRLSGWPPATVFPPSVPSTPLGRRHRRRAVQESCAMEVKRRHDHLRQATRVKPASRYCLPAAAIAI